MLAELTSSAASEQRRSAFFARLWTTVNAYLTLATPDDGRRAWELVVRRMGLEAEYLRSERAAALRGSGSHILHELGTVRAQLARAVIAGDTAKAEPLRGRRDELEKLLAGYLAAGVEAPDAKTVAAAAPLSPSVSQPATRRTGGSACLRLSSQPSKRLRQNRRSGSTAGSAAVTLRDHPGGLTVR